MHGEIFARNGSIRLCAQTSGPPDGEPLLLIMGATASMLWWPDGFVEGLAASGFHAARFDHRDTGRSTSVPSGKADYTVHDMADDALAVMDRLGWESAHIAGMSLGGLLGQLIALRDPDRVRTLTLISSQMFGDPGVETRPIAPEVLELFGKLGDVDWNSRANAVAFLTEMNEATCRSSRAPLTQALADLAAAEFDRAANPSSRFNHAVLDGVSPWADRTGEIQAPVLVIHGDQDVVVDPVHAAAIKRVLPDARIVMLEGAGHELHPDDWPLIIAEMRAHASRWPR